MKIILTKMWLYELSRILYPRNSNKFTLNNFIDYEQNYLWKLSWFKGENRVEFCNFIANLKMVSNLSYQNVGAGPVVIKRTGRGFIESQDS